MMLPKERESLLTVNVKKLTVFICTSLVFLSCTSNTIYEKPKDLIPKDSMILLLKDMYVASSARNIKNKRLQRRFSYMPLVYAKYKIDSARFQRSNFYYTSKIDEYEPMLAQVMKLLEDERAIFVAYKKVKDSVRQDSIKKVRAKMVEEKKFQKFALDTTKQSSKKLPEKPKE